MRRLFVVAGLAASLVAMPASAALDYFLNIDTIEGDSTHKDHKDWIDVDSWAWGVTYVGANSGGSGGGSGKAVFQDFSWTQGMDSSVVPMFLGVATGKQYKKATLDVVASGEGQKSFFQMVFSDVSLHKLSQQGSGDGIGVDAALGYASVQMRYRPQDAKGGFGDWIEGTFDIKGGKAAFSGNPLVVEGLMRAGGSLDFVAPVANVPEPGTYAMFALGLLALAVARRRGAA